jgi:DnaJ homolog subfamily A member 2
MVCDTKLYNILEIEPNSTESEIKKAYRKMATIWHPDKHKTNKEIATEKFKEINEAYEVLSNKDKRKLYDKYGENMNNPQFTNENIFDGMMGGMGFEHMMSGMNGNNMSEFMNKKTNNKTIHPVIINISINEIFTGFNKKISIKFKQKCPNCEVVFKTCSECNGKGVKVKMQQIGPMIQHCRTTCNKCSQTGKIKSKNNCNNCNKSGTIPITKEHIIVFNKNDDYNEIITLKQMGDYNFETKTQDDIHIKFEIKKSEYNIKTHDIIYNYKINISNALMIKNIYFKHPNEKIYLFQSDTCIRSNDVKIIPKLGLPSKYSYGNLIIKFEYKYPEHIIKNEEELTNYLFDEKNETYDTYETIKLIDLEQFKNETNNQDDNIKHHKGGHTQQCQQM